MAWLIKTNTVGRMVAALAMILPSFAGGCASPASDVAVAAKTKLVGMPTDDFLLCMGPPQAKQREGGIDFLIYKSSSRIEQRSTSTYISRSNTTTVNTCTANVAIRGGKVASINYVGDTDDLFSPGHYCAEIVANCMRGR